MGKLLAAISYCKIKTTYKDCSDCPLEEYGTTTWENIRRMDDKFAKNLMKEYDRLAEKARNNNYDK